jgi:beta-glucosidase
MNAHTDCSNLIDSLEPSPRFPSDFCWGVATSSFQIEGAAQEGGKGESIWDTFCRVPGAIADGSNGDLACGHVHRLEEDLDLIASLGVNAYRFSVSWPRVQPLGQGPWSEQGMDFYGRLLDGLARRGIKAHMTLNHWDLPQALQDQGGWASRQTVHHFVCYAREMARRFGSRVEAITTHNEPWVVAFLGHESGIFAPGLKSRATAIQVSHHLLLSHGLALRALRADGCPARLGIVLNLAPMVPAADSPEDVAKARLEDGRLLRWFMDPMFRGSYPQDVLDHLGEDAPKVEEGDLRDIAAPLDYLGINYYSRSVVSAGEPFDVKSSGLALTEMGWEIYPQGLTELLVRLHRDYAVPPIYITENGGAFPDHLSDGRVHDSDRISYLSDHIAAVGDAIRQGVPVVGYMVWSLMDNFEWASGYEKRFGIVHVDYQTLKRTLKDSARWYQRFLQAQQSKSAGPARADASVKVSR